MRQYSIPCNLVLVHHLFLHSRLHCDELMTLTLDQPATCTHLCFSHNNNSRLHKRVILAYIYPCTATCVVRSVEVDVRPILRKSTTRSGVGPTMLNRSKSSKDIRSRIKHENVRLGAGTQMGGVPNNFGLQTNAFQVQSQRTHQHSPSLGHRRDVFDAPDLYGGTSELPSHNAHPLGAGPSFVSLSPSDSISNLRTLKTTTCHPSFCQLATRCPIILVS